MTFETNQVAGVNNIVTKLVELPFQKVAHKLSTLDAQPAGDAGQILVHVTGHLIIDDNEHPQAYSQTFQLVPADGTYYVLNDIMRLSY
ncbi:nuclear transport factor 2 [Ascobolus immersus RN42]|uniref:Nuclear transport factor 2 n=1 Tax=Ascobolus immersus RN42 TaxID=1160509 RepID=A0A3N4IUH0_ASCIM|nr:nuclear transport factor 2 [Ascobolus immersus RN42]